MDAIKLDQLDLNIAQFLAVFEKFNAKERAEIARKIWMLTFGEQWKILDNQLPDLDVSEQEVMDELMAVRYGKEATA
jgi:hypothetical protein